MTDSNGETPIENMTSQKLDRINSWLEDQRDLFSDRYSILWKRKGFGFYYTRIKEMTQKETRLIRDYQNVRKRLNKDPHFTPEELEDIAAAYAALLGRANQGLDGLTTLVESFQSPMEEQARMILLRELSQQLDSVCEELAGCNKRYVRYSMQRAGTPQELKRIQKLYGVRIL